MLKLIYPAGIYLFKVYHGNSRTMSKICSKFTIKTPERCHWTFCDYMIWKWRNHFVAASLWVNTCSKSTTDTWTMPLDVVLPSLFSVLTGNRSQVIQMNSLISMAFLDKTCPNLAVKVLLWQLMRQCYYKWAQPQVFVGIGL